MTEPRIIPPEEARRLMDQGDRPIYDGKVTRLDLAHTAAVLGEQREAALALHTGHHWCANAERTGVYTYGDLGGLCPTARALSYNWPGLVIVSYT